MDSPVSVEISRPRADSSTKPRRLAAVSMVRNDADIILPFLRQCEELFDTTYIIDIKSTDGTRERIEQFDGGRGRFVVFTIDRQEKYQGAMMNTLSRRAFEDGADWVFLLDADEFIDISSRIALEAHLANFNADVMHLSWVNLVPTTYGSFTEFEPDQEFHWSGRVSTFYKVALSNLFAANHPEFFIHEGNHHVSPRRGAAELPPSYGLPLLHVPIRSAPRFKYKISGALRITKAKHNRFAGEGSHVEALDRLLASNVTSGELNHLAGHYGESVEHAQELTPTDLDWPVKRLPPFVRAHSGHAEAPALDASQTLLRDRALTWDQTSFVPGTPVAALLEGDSFRIVPQPMYGNGRLRHARFERLGETKVDPRSPGVMLADAAGIACMRIKHYAFSAWSELIPVLFALVSVTRPRRMVELGVHNGMSFFAGCQAIERLGLGTECVAVDSWVGDEHAGFHSDEVFTGFKSYCDKNYPGQVYIQSYFEAALGCFEDGSIDLLHIDGLHTYDAVRSDFESWLPKLSETGVIMFHDTNVLERDFGVWRLWEELRSRYPGHNFLHKHGLGIIYVGSAPSPIATILRDITSNTERSILAQTFFEAAGTLSVEHRTRQDESERFRADADAARVEMHRVYGELTTAQASLLQETAQALQEIERLRGNVAAAEARTRVEAERLQLVYQSTTWRAMGPVRRVLRAFPLLHRIVRAPLRSVRRAVGRWQF